MGRRNITNSLCSQLGYTWHLLWPGAPSIPFSCPCRYSIINSAPWLLFYYEGMKAWFGLVWPNLHQCEGDQSIPGFVVSKLHPMPQLEEGSPILHNHYSEEMQDTSGRQATAYRSLIKFSSSMPVIPNISPPSSSQRVHQSTGCQTRHLLNTHLNMISRFLVEPQHNVSESFQWEGRKTHIIVHTCSPLMQCLYHE